MVNPGNREDLKKMAKVRLLWAVVLLRHRPLYPLIPA